MMNIVRNGAIMAVYVFVVIIMYMVLSSPFDEIMTNYDDVNITSSDAQVEAGTIAGRTVFNMIFAMIILVPVIWFIFLCFQREPDWRE